MFCQNCGNKADQEDSFCNGCGIKLSYNNEQDVVNDKKDFVIHPDFCDICGKNAEVKYVKFYENRGALVMRYHREIKGKLCKKCINGYFWKFTLTTVAIGWLGTISFIVTPFYIINNVGWYLWTKVK